MQEQVTTIVEEVMLLYTKYGAADYIGEPVSQIEHMCQCAQLAERDGYDREVILAAFMHDIGHLYGNVLEASGMKGYGITDHDQLGAGYLRSKGFSEKISRLVGSHVATKRYLTFKYPDYYSKLSLASKQTLVVQGGKMSEHEAEAFEKEEWFGLYVTLRLWDEQAKEENIPLPSLLHYRQMMEEHLAIQAVPHT